MPSRIVLLKYKSIPSTRDPMSESSPELGSWVVVRGGDRTREDVRGRHRQHV